MARPHSVTYTEDTSYQVGYSYNNSIGKLDTLIYPASTGASPLAVKYGYSYGVLTQVRDDTNGVLGTQYWTLNATDDANRDVDESLGNGVRILSTYDTPTGLMLFRQSGSVGSTSNLQNLTYQWDLNGNLLQRQDAVQNAVETFGYDALNRLTSAAVNNDTPVSIDFDATGNITSKSDVGTTSHTYDYTTQQVGCSYTGLPLQPHAVRNAGGRKSYGARRGGNWKGGVSSSDWTAISNATRVGYTGQTMLDNLTLVHMNGRVYDPVIGRFLSADPIVQAPENSQSWNRFSYVLNRPLAFVWLSNSDLPPVSMGGAWHGGFVMVDIRESVCFGRSAPCIAGNCLGRRAQSFTAELDVLSPAMAVYTHAMRRRQS